MENLPLYISVTLGIATFFTVFFFYRATHRSLFAVMVVLIWLIIQTIISLAGFYTVTNSMPPRFALLLAPPLLLIAGLFMTINGRAYIDKLDLRSLTILHVVRIPVELVIFWLYVNKTVPELMTFEGQNFDIISGLTASIIFYVGFARKRIHPTMLLAWNLICLGFLINIVYHAIFSAPFPFQKFAFDQPNIALLYFPFTLLPCCIVPLVLFAHLAAIRQLLKFNGNQITVTQTS